MNMIYTSPHVQATPEKRGLIVILATARLYVLPTASSSYPLMTGQTATRTGTYAKAVGIEPTPANVKWGLAKATTRRGAGSRGS